MTNTGGTPAGWYHAPGDPEGTQRYWDGAQWIGDPQAVPQQAAPAAPQAPQEPQPSDATVAYRPPAAGSPAGGQPPQYAAPQAGGQAPQYGAPPAGQQPPAFGAPGSQPPAYGSPPPGAGAPPGYTAFGGPGAAPQTGDLAEGWQRIVARLVDGVLWVVVGILFSVVLVGGSLVTGSGGSYFVSLVASLLSLAVVVAYEVFMTTKTGNTLGKKIFNLRIVNIDGTAVDEKTMIMRMLPYIGLVLLAAIIPILGPLLSALGYLVIGVMSIIFLFTDSMRQAVWDKIAKTKVIVTV